jgi:hypothetical protein
VVARSSFPAKTRVGWTNALFTGTGYAEITEQKQNYENVIFIVESATGQTFHQTFEAYQRRLLIVPGTKQQGG